MMWLVISEAMGRGFSLRELISRAWICKNVNFFGADLGGADLSGSTLKGALS